MHVGQISFCDGVGYNIKSDEDKERIMAELKAFGLSVLARQFERMGSDGTTRAIRDNPHMLSVRTHGNPYYVYLTTVNGVQQCIFVDKKIQQGYFQPRMILTKLWFDASLFSGTIFDGEMVRCRHGSWTFLVNDIIVDCGAHLANVNLIRRVNRLYEILSREYVADGMDPCRLEVKKYFKYDNATDMVHSFIPSLPYDIRGIIFKSLYLKFRDVLLDFRNESDIKHGRECMKTKRTKLSKGFMFSADMREVPSVGSGLSYPPSSTPSSSADEQDPMRIQGGSNAEAKTLTAIIKQFDIRKTSLPDVYELIVDKGLNKRELACIPNLALSKDMRAAFASVGVAETLQMRCAFHDKFKKWVPQPPTGPRGAA